VSPLQRLEIGGEKQIIFNNPRSRIKPKSVPGPNILFIAGLSIDLDDFFCDLSIFLLT